MLPTILIVDDNRLARRLLLRRLGSDEYRLEEAESGEEALERVMELRPDLVLLDVVMPGIDGFEVCRRIRSRREIRDVPVVLVTSLEDRKSLLTGIEAGADDFVSKSSDAAEIRARVRSIVQLNRYRRLLAERSRLERVVRTSDDGFLIVGPSGGPLYANPAARRFLGLGPDDDLPDRDFPSLAESRYRLEPAEAWRTFPNDVEEPRWLVRPESGDTPPLWLEVSTLVPTAEERDEGERLVRLRDATSQMTVKRDMWRFQALVAHKLRTPLTVVLGSLDLLSRDRGPAVDVPRVARLALESARRLNEQILDVLSFLSSPDLALPGQGFRLGDLQKLSAELAAGLGVPAPSVDVDAALRDRRLVLGLAGFEVVLREVLDNAKKFHPRNEPGVTIRAARLGADHADAPLWALLEIEDDGNGIPPELLGRIWTPYFQSERGFSGNVAGMGLGLSMVATVVWNAGGDCEARNRPAPESGALIELRIPVARSAGATGA